MNIHNSIMNIQKSNYEYFKRGRFTQLLKILSLLLPQRFLGDYYNVHRKRLENFHGRTNLYKCVLQNIYNTCKPVIHPLMDM
jgi:hypothetical protein